MDLGARARLSRGAATPRPPVRPSRPNGDARAWTGGAAAVALAVVLAGSALFVDTRGAAAFDAPKRLVTIVGLVVAAGLVAVGRTTIAWRPPARPQRLSLAALGLGLAWCVVATLASPHPAIARAGLRTLLLVALALPLGASGALAGTRGRWLLGVFAGAAAVNALASLAQSAGVELFATEAITGRSDTGAFLGNEGHLAQLLALAGVACGTVWLLARTAAVRIGAGVVVCLAVAALLVSRNLTAVATLAAGGTVALLLARGRRGVVPLVVGAALVATAVVAHPAFRARIGEAATAARSGDWDAVTTYRLGPWAAALEMARERPLVGFGPGTFGAEFMAHRLVAEARWHERLTIPLLTSSFGEAHSEYLQAMADAGLPAASAAVVALVALLGPLARAARGDGDGARRAEAVVLAAVLVAGAVAALTWFPLQLPATAVPLLLAAGRGWRLLDGDTGGDAGASHGRAAAAAVGTLAALGLLTAAAVPEMRRYGAEHTLADATAAIATVAGAGRVVPHEAPRLAKLAAMAESTAATMPGDSRGLVAAGTAMLVAGKPAEARARYRAALARGERAEIDLNLGRAYALAGRAADAEAALLRAAWLSPALVETLPEGDRTRLTAAVADLEARLRAGTLPAPPPLPADE